MTAQTSQFDLNHWIYRLIALIIDSIIVGIPAGIIYALVIVPILWPTTFLYGYAITVGAPWWGSFLLLFILGLFQIFYYAILETYWGATIGKRVLGLNVQMINGSRLTFDKAFLRNISKIYGLLLLLDWIIGIVTPGADNHQKYTDRIAGTTVVSIKQPFAAGVPPPPPPPPPT